MLAPDFGIVDFVTRALGLGSHNWLGDPQLALVSVIAIHTWQWTPFAFLVILASLASLPPDVFEAARIDRASAWRRFVHITLPLIRPAIVIVVIMRMMIALSAFAAIFAATGGGPGTATEILNLYAYRTSFAELNLGYGAALAMVLLAITLAVSFLMFRLRRGAMKRARAAHARAVAVAALLLAVWAFPVLWGAAHVAQDRARRARLSADASSSSRRSRTIARCCSAPASILPNLVSSLIVAGCDDGC